MRPLQLLSLALLATAVHADPLFYALTGASAYCDSEGIWQRYTVASGDRFFAAAADDGSCTSVGVDGHVHNGREASLDQLYKSAYSADFGNVIVVGDMFISGPDLIVPPTDASSFELTAPVKWYAEGSGRRDPLSAGPDYVPSDEADFWFTGRGTGIGYFDFARRDGILRVATITYSLVATPEPGSVWLLAAGCLLLLHSVQSLLSRPTKK